MIRIKRLIFIATILLILATVGFWAATRINLFRTYTVGQTVDSLNGVAVYYNGDISNISGRSVTADHYNLGKKYQCVEFVKRYYYERLHHKMPDTFGHAKDFFEADLPDGKLNKKRGLIQYTNPSFSKPKVDDLVVFGQSTHGHVAIISKVSDDEVEIVQQNPGPYGRSRVDFDISFEQGKWKIENQRILGWLRKE
jgi:surface antigen